MVLICGFLLYGKLITDTLLLQISSSQVTKGHKAVMSHMEESVDFRLEINFKCWAYGMSAGGGGGGGGGRWSSNHLQYW